MLAITTKRYNLMIYSHYDTHVHTKYSCDSNEEFETYCMIAMQRGVKTIYFTDHVDCNCNDTGCGFYKPEKFFSEFMHIKEKYKDMLTLLCGVEFAEPHKYKDSLTKYHDLPYDYILGSIHWWYDDMWASEIIKQEIPASESFSKYWEEVLAAVKSGNFDCLAHIDFPKRYHNKLVFESTKICDICTEMVRNNICLEINASSLRQNAKNGTMPDKELLEIYESCGGRYVTFASDAHKAEDLGMGYEYAKKLIDFFGLQEAVFIQRELRDI